MSQFFLISAALVVAFLVPLIITLLRKPPATEASNTRTQNIAIARDRLAELEKTHTSGELSDEEFAQAKQDLQVALAEDINQASEAHATSNNKARYATILLLLICIPVFVSLFYQEVGAPEHLAVIGPGEPAKPLKELPPIEELIAQLEQRLQQDPSNAEGWFLLGRTYMKLSQYANAVRAYEQLHKLLPEDATAKLSLADALAMQNGGTITPRSMTLLEETIAIQPDSVTALWLLGQASIQKNQPDKAIGYWQRAYPLLAKQPQAQQQLGQMLAELQGTDKPALAAPATTPDNADNDAGLLVEVALDAELLNKVSPQDSLFIYAKAAKGPPMPLAVARKTVADLPIKVRLNDSMAMLPQMRLSNFDQVRVRAHISKNGKANVQAGDLQSAEIVVANNHAEAIQLIINSQIGLK
jgi:cytochrome c-type biogenesis protein CcmH